MNNLSEPHENCGFGKKDGQFPQWCCVVSILPLLLGYFYPLFLPEGCLITLPLAAVPLLPANVNLQQKSIP